MDGKNATYVSGVALTTSVASFLYLNNEMKNMKEEIEKLKQGLFRTGQVVSNGNNQTIPLVRGLQSKITEVEAKLDHNQMMMEKGTLSKKIYIRKTPPKKKVSEPPASTIPSSISVMKEEDEEDAIINRIKRNPN